MYLSLYNYQGKASRYRKWLTYLKIRVTTNQKYTLESHKPEIKESKHNTKESYQTTKGKTKRNKEEIKKQRKGRYRPPKT